MRKKHGHSLECLFLFHKYKNPRCHLLQKQGKSQLSLTQYTVPAAKVRLSVSEIGPLCKELKETKIERTED